jgi:toxin ParE1/3/4
MPLHRFSPEALDDINAIWVWSSKRFGVTAAQRYELLIEQAVSDLANSPYRTGSQPFAVLGESLRVYHLQQSRRRVARAKDRVKRPRHVIYYRILDDSMIEIVRILHDQMNPFLYLED